MIYIIKNLETQLIKEQNWIFFCNQQDKRNKYFYQIIIKQSYKQKPSHHFYVFLVLEVHAFSNSIKRSYQVFFSFFSVCITVFFYLFKYWLWPGWEKWYPVELSTLLLTYPEWLSRQNLRILLVSPIYICLQLSFLQQIAQPHFVLPLSFILGYLSCILGNTMTHSSYCS